MAFMDKVQGLWQKVKTRSEGEQPQLMSNRANGGFSGYQPKITKRKPAENLQPDHPATGFSGMMPGGVDATVMQQFQQVGGQTGTMPPQQQTMPQGRPMTPPQPHARQAGPAMQRPAAPQQPAQQTGWQPRMQNPVQPQQPMQQTGWQPAFPQHQIPPQSTGWQPPVQQPAPQPQPQQKADDGLRYFPGTYVSDEGSAYKMVLRVAQITGVASCYRLIEFMQNSEAMIVNAEQIADVMEADRCMDLLFGAAYAMNQNFVRISGKMIYLITPKQMQVIPFDSLLHMSNEDIERRWPGSSRGYQENRFGGFAAKNRQEDFAPAYGQRAARSAQAGAYTDYGGFGMRR